MAFESGLRRTYIGFLDWVVVAARGASPVPVMEIHNRLSARLFQY